MNKLLAMDKLKCAKVIAIYYSLPDEVDTTLIIDKILSLNKVVCLPKIQGDMINFYRIESLSDLEKGRFNLLEPKTNNLINKEEIELIIVPGIVFDIRGYRVGYGKGYYDKYLKDIGAYKVGLTYKEMVIDKVDNDSFDVPVDEVIFD